MWPSSEIAPLRSSQPSCHCCQGFLLSICLGTTKLCLKSCTWPRRQCKRSIFSPKTASNGRGMSQAFRAPIEQRPQLRIHSRIGANFPCCGSSVHSKERRISKLRCSPSRESECFELRRGWLAGLPITLRSPPERFKEKGSKRPLGMIFRHRGPAKEAPY